MAFAQPIFRFYNESNGVHFYTASADETNSVLANLPQYRFEGPAFEVNGGNIPVYRFFNKTTGTHFYTADEGEKDNVIATLPNFEFEGVAFNAFQLGTQGDLPVHRFFNTDAGNHFYTNDQNERAFIEGNLPHLSYEGGVFRLDIRTGHLNGTENDDTLTSRDSKTGVELDLFGLNGNDTLVASDGNRAHGGNGDDTLKTDPIPRSFTGETSFSFHGGTGADNFVIKGVGRGPIVVDGKLGGNFKFFEVTVDDYDPSEGDRLTLDSSDLPEPLQLKFQDLSVESSASGTTITFSKSNTSGVATGTINLTGVDASNLSADDFIFIE